MKNTSSINLGADEVRIYLTDLRTGSILTPIKMDRASAIDRKSKLAELTAFLVTNHLRPAVHMKQMVTELGAGSRRINIFVDFYSREAVA